MKYAVCTSNFGNCGDARLLAEIAHTAEAAGWDGCFLWDHVNWPNMEPIVDPWVALGAMAMRTERIRLGTMVTPIARRRPTKLAREAVTLDRLTGGRVTLGLGNGIWPEEFGPLGDESDQAAGGTWWVEYRHSWVTSLGELLERVRRGPPGV